MTKILHKSHCHRYSVHAHEHTFHIDREANNNRWGRKKYFQHVAEGVGDKRSFLCLVWLYLGNCEQKIIFFALSLSQKNIAQYRPSGFILFPPHISLMILILTSNRFFMCVPAFVYTNDGEKKWKILAFFSLNFFFCYAWLREQRESLW